MNIFNIEATYHKGEFIITVKTKDVHNGEALLDKIKWWTK